MGFQFIDRQIFADIHVSEVVEPLFVSHFLVNACDPFDLLLIWSHAVSDQPERRRQFFEHVDIHAERGAEKSFGRIEAARTAPDDGDAKGAGFSSQIARHSSPPGRVP